MTTRTYIDLIATIQGLCGVDFATVELSRIIALINRRAKKAYNASNFWPRYLHVGEERTVTSNVIGYTQTGLDDIGVFLSIHRTRPFIQASAQEYTFIVTAVGATIISGTLDPTSAFVTYKEEYTPAITALSTDIPGEWFEYLAHGTYADFLRSEGQQEKAMIADAESVEILTDELILLDEQRIAQVVANRVSTNLNMQTR